MPLYAVLRLEHPVVLIRDIQDAALDATPLQRRECGHSLIGRHPVIQLPRSEEHTSELQSLMRISYAVFCLTKNIHHASSSHGCCSYRSVDSPSTSASLTSFT